MFDIIILRANSVIYDSRVRKIAKSLNKKYSVLILGWNRDAVPKNMIYKHYKDLHLCNIKAPYGKPLLIVYYPFFWIWIFFQLIKYRPKVIHACDLDTIIPAYLYKLLFKKRLVFDVFDRYALGYIPQKFKILYNLINSFEEIISHHVDVLITVGEQLLNTWKKIPMNHFIIFNCSEDRFLTRLKSPDNILRLVYTGNIQKNRCLEKVTTIVKDLENVKFFIAGRPLDKVLFDEIINLPNIVYKGILLPEESLILEANSDVMVALDNLKDPQNNVALPNKLFEAMMCGIPIITNVATQVVKESNCGIIVDFDSTDQIRSVIIELRDNIDLRSKLGNNGRNSFIEKYSWDVMEKKLYKIYNSLNLK
jgi:glycosyltransferase involved in cell wall biosynthesis